MDKGTVRGPRADRLEEGNGNGRRNSPPQTLAARSERALARLSPEEREFLDALIARSGLINRVIMRLYLAVDVRGLDRWWLHIQRMNRRKLKRFEMFSYWPLRLLERLSAIYIGGSLTAAEQRTFGLICRIEDYKLSRYNSIIFGLWAGVFFFSSGNLAHWMGGMSGLFSGTFDLTSLLLYSVGAISVAVDLFRAIDSYARKRAHMPFGVLPLVLNSTTFFKRLLERGGAGSEQ
ncbi:hypothetical protein LLH00_15255 [bacterium]|nr:hypothetical protein [bacterium]